MTKGLKVGIFSSPNIHDIKLRNSMLSLHNQSVDLLLLTSVSIYQYNYINEH